MISGHSRNYEWLYQIVEDCPEYAELIQRVESRQIDLIVTVAYERLFRTDSLRAQLTSLCRQNRVQLFSIAQPIEPVNPLLLQPRSTAKLSEILYGFIAEEENITRQRRRRVGMEARIRRGLHGCAGVVPYGYKHVGDSSVPLVPDPEQVSWVQWIFERRAEGWGYTALLRGLYDRGVRSPGGGDWAMSTLRHVLTSPFYRGTVRWGSVSNDNGLHEALVSRELWQRAQDVSKSRRAWYYGPNPRALTGLCRCAFCGWRMAYNHSRGGLELRCGQR